MLQSTLDITRDECRGILRRLELDSYSNVVSTFRAQGGLNDIKKKILEDLRNVFRISQDRHRAEVRRVANDERLCTIAEAISGPNTTEEWCQEGRRSYPLLSRSFAYTAYSSVANVITERMIDENSKLPSSDEYQKQKELFYEEMKIIQQQKKIENDDRIQNNCIKIPIVKDDPLIPVLDEKKKIKRPLSMITEDNSNSIQFSPSSPQRARTISYNNDIKSNKQQQQHQHQIVDEKLPQSQQLQKNQKHNRLIIHHNNHTNLRIQQLYHSHCKTVSRHKKSSTSSSVTKRKTKYMNHSKDVINDHNHHHHNYQQQQHQQQHHQQQQHQQPQLNKNNGPTISNNSAATNNILEKTFSSSSPSLSENNNFNFNVPNPQMLHTYASSQNKCINQTNLRNMEMNKLLSQHDTINSGGIDYVQSSISVSSQMKYSHHATSKKDIITNNLLKMNSSSHHHQIVKQQHQHQHHQNSSDTIKKKSNILHINRFPNDNKNINIPPPPPPTNINHHKITSPLSSPSSSTLPIIGASGGSGVGDKPTTTAVSTTILSEKNFNKVQLPQSSPIFSSSTSISNNSSSNSSSSNNMYSSSSSSLSSSNSKEINFINKDISNSSNNLLPIRRSSTNPICSSPTVVQIKPPSIVTLDTKKFVKDLAPGNSNVQQQQIIKPTFVNHSNSSLLAKRKIHITNPQIIHPVKISGNLQNCKGVKIISSANGQMFLQQSPSQQCTTAITNSSVPKIARIITQKNISSASGVATTPPTTIFMPVQKASSITPTIITGDGGGGSGNSTGSGSALTSTTLTSTPTTQTSIQTQSNRIAIQKVHILPRLSKHQISSISASKSLSTGNPIYLHPANLINSSTTNNSNPNSNNSNQTSPISSVTKPITTTTTTTAADNNSTSNIGQLSSSLIADNLILDNRIASPKILHSSMAVNNGGIISLGTQSSQQLSQQQQQQQQQQNNVIVIGSVPTTEKDYKNDDIQILNSDNDMDGNDDGSIDNKKNLITEDTPVYILTAPDTNLDDKTSEIDLKCITETTSITPTTINQQQQQQEDHNQSSNFDDKTIETIQIINSNEIMNTEENDDHHIDEYVEHTVNDDDDDDNLVTEMIDNVDNDDVNDDNDVQITNQEQIDDVKQETNENENIIDDDDYFIDENISATGRSSSMIDAVDETINENDDITELHDHYHHSGAIIHDENVNTNNDNYLQLEQQQQQQQQQQQHQHQQQRQLSTKNQNTYEITDWEAELDEEAKRSKDKNYNSKLMHNDSGVVNIDNSNFNNRRRQQFQSQSQSYRQHQNQQRQQFQQQFQNNKRLLSATSGTVQLTTNGIISNINNNNNNNNIMDINSNNSNNNNNNMTMTMTMTATTADSDGDTDNNIIYVGGDNFNDVIEIEEGCIDTTANDDEDTSIISYSIDNHNKYSDIEEHDDDLHNLVEYETVHM